METELYETTCKIARWIYDRRVGDPHYGITTADREGFCRGAWQFEQNKYLSGMVGVVYADPMAEPRYFLFGLIRRPAHRRFIARIFLDKYHLNRNEKLSIEGPVDLKNWVVFVNGPYEDFVYAMLFRMMSDLGVAAELTVRTSSQIIEEDTRKYNVGMAGMLYER